MAVRAIASVLTFAQVVGGGPSQPDPIHAVRSALGICRPGSAWNLAVVRVRGYFILIPSLGLDEIGALLDRRMPDAHAYSERMASGGIERLRVTKRALLVDAALQGPGRLRQGIPNHTWVVVRGRLACTVYQIQLGERAWIGVRSWRRVLTLFVTRPTTAGKRQPRSNPLDTLAASGRST